MQEIWIAPSHAHEPKYKTKSENDIWKQDWEIKYPKFLILFDKDSIGKILPSKNPFIVLILKFPQIFFCNSW